MTSITQPESLPLVTVRLSFLLAGITSRKGIRLGNRLSETLFSYKKQIVATKQDSGTGAGGGRVGGGRAQLRRHSAEDGAAHTRWEMLQLRRQRMLQWPHLEALILTLLKIH